MLYNKFIRLVKWLMVKKHLKMNMQSTSYYKYYSHSTCLCHSLSHTHTRIGATQGSASCPMILRHVNWRHSYNNIWSSLINRCTLHDMTKAYNYFMVMLIMLMSSYGLSVFGLTLALEILWTASMPLVHLPNTVCLLSSQGCRKTEAHKEI